MQLSRAWSALVVLAGCSTPSLHVIDIVAVDYAFQAPSAVPPGPTRFRLINSGRVLHEVQLFRFRPGVSADSGRTLLALEHFPDSLADGSGAVLIAAVGDTTSQQVYAYLEQGQVYALVCQFRDSASAPRHDRLGMFAVLRVAREMP
jgi:hypothetical protein